MEKPDTSRKRTAVRRSFSAKNASVNTANLLELINISSAVYGVSYKPDLIIKRKARNLARLLNKPEMDYALISQHASDILIAAKKALNAKNKKK